MPPRSNFLNAILLIVLAGAILAGMDSIGKHMTSLMPVLQVVWGRYVVQTLTIGLFLRATTGPGFMRPRRPVVQLLRGLSLLGATILMYLALSRVPLADATAMLFFSPILVTVLSVVVLKETIGIHRICAVVAGFLGMLLILQPGFDAVDPYLFLALVAAVFNAIFLMLTRQLAGADDARSTRFHTTAAGAVILSVIVIPFWEPLTPGLFGLIVLVGVLGAMGHSTLVRAFALASASLLSPFLYSQVLVASLLSAFVLGDPLRPLMILGTAILVASGVYIWWREQRNALPTP